MNIIATEYVQSALRQDKHLSFVPFFLIAMLFGMLTEKKITLLLSRIPVWPFIASAPVCLRRPNTTCYHALSDSPVRLILVNPLQSALPIAQAALERRRPCIFEDSHLFLEVPFLDTGCGCTCTCSLFTSHCILILYIIIKSAKQWTNIHLYNLEEM